MKKRQVFLLTLALFGHLVFWGYYALTGRVYGGAAEDSSYITFMMVIDIIPIMMFIRYLTSKQSKNSLSFPVIILLFFLFLLLIESNFSFNHILVKSYIAYSIPAALVGILFAKYNSGNQFAKLLEPMMLFLTLEGASSMSLILATSFSELAEAGIGAQSLSYYCGFAFSLNLYFILFGDELKERFKYTKTVIYKIISAILLVVQIGVSISSGGRGGFVLIVVSAIVLVGLKLVRSKGNLVRTAAVFILIGIVFIGAVQLMPQNINKAINEGAQRTFSYITRSGIDMSETSNRDDVYGKTLQDIQRKPLFGYGLLMKGSYAESSWPHNIFLEILLQGGIMYFILFIVFIIIIARKLHQMIKRGHGLYIIPVVLYPFVMLLFSGSYIATGLFWFDITYVYCFEFRNQ